MKLVERLKAIEQFVFEHHPSPEIRTHFHLLTEHLEMEDSLLDTIVQKDEAHAQVVAAMSAEKAQVDREKAELQAEIARRDSEDAKAFSGAGGFIDRTGG